MLGVAVVVMVCASLVCVWGGGAVGLKKKKLGGLRKGAQRWGTHESFGATWSLVRGRHRMGHRGACQAPVLSLLWGP